MRSSQCVQLPGAFNGLVARMLPVNGFVGGYVSGGALSAASGVPDIGLLTLDQFTDKIKEVVAFSGGLPFICDADTGFGSDEMVSKTVREYIAAGAAGLHIEDQEFPKRCGHLEGKTLVSADEMMGKVRRARAAADAAYHGESDHFIICARTDAYSTHGMEEAIARAKQYVEAGADMIFPEGLATIEDFRAFAEQMQRLGEMNLAPQGGPFLLANMTEFGKTDAIKLDEFASAGYNCVIYPVSTLRCAMKAADECLRHLKSEQGLKQHEGKMQTRKQLYELLK
ncbi:2-methylisocitrate lyase, putative [Perkinsus marinus ATCC 50983]|uniref:2-methylisocitrate lyase, putative n=1 Tax=Perkinsus marinus (strain ATCC 50983 / TXsc) TaxID=423536 RepID=C5KE59_PERM5|nr:2-methylisocitrate lyase, putative [Perkinsus marinus ATCC 50983]EER17271.1 2-methylisocitrate lyase, putative [Perkinsus marinus ATCC 50983]|eukprot:XP_002785475.1 2-methylisocitrate lyase, putative [Perkinsus marinus ATCC 50983]